MTPEEAITVIRRQITALAMDEAEWEDYPGIGEFDWEEICGPGIKDQPTHEEFHTAYAVLQARADQEAVS